MMQCDEILARYCSKLTKLSNKQVFFGNTLLCCHCNTKT